MKNGIKNRFHRPVHNSKRLASVSGFSLIEVLLAISIFSILATGIYFTYANIIEVLGRTRTHTLATSMLNKQIEMIRNLPFDSVGIVGGSPPGVIPASTTVNYEGQQFVTSAFVRNIDDPFDGILGGAPNDTAPADYRLVELIVDCPTCFNFMPVTFTTWVAPQNLENSTQNGALFVNVFDANGQPVSNANVLVKNTSTTPTITISETTNNSGTLKLVDIATSTNAYQVTVSKNGYTTQKTYTPGDAANPNPNQPHATVASQQITSVSFAIDLASTINVATKDQYCAAVPLITMTQNGEKLIGSDPNTLLYSQQFTTSGSGVSERTDLEWDTYSFNNNDVFYDFAGSNPLFPLITNPNTTTDLVFLVEPKASTSLLVTVVSSSGAPISGADVVISKTGFQDQQTTGEKFFAQTDWSSSQYTSQDGMIDDNNPAGELHISSVGGAYATNTNSYLESDTIDFGTANTDIRWLTWAPTSQSANTELKFQVASAASSGGPWSYKGPNGTGSTYYTATSTLSTFHDGNRYLRYKIFMQTFNSTVTPVVRDVSVGFSSDCTPSGQAFWREPPTGSYSITATKSGYQTASTTITVGSGWQESRLIMQ